ncbi:hypothetical protein JHK87_012359 [Glycine soja]|nr:hypothetical protein JHK87_012359 [Glycine soja]
MKTQSRLRTFNNKFNHLLTDEFVPVNTNADKLYDEMLNLQNVVAFLHRTKINASTDSSVTTGSDLCNVITGARQIPGESRLNLL